MALTSNINPHSSAKKEMFIRNVELQRNSKKIFFDEKSNLTSIESQSRGPDPSSVAPSNGNNDSSDCDVSEAEID